MGGLIVVVVAVAVAEIGAVAVLRGLLLPVPRGAASLPNQPCFQIWVLLTVRT